MAIIEARHLTKRFSILTAVDHIDLTIQEGEVFGFLGPNGAGKTTTIKMLTTLLPPSDGRATIAGYDMVRQAQQVRQVIGLVPQELTVDDELTGWENIMLQSRLYHVPDAVAKQRAQELLDLVDLTDAKRRLVRTYSGGMRKRLELAEGLVHRPRILFLDEPTLGLDVQTRAVMWDYIQKLNRDYGITLFLTTHYMEEADLLCHRLAIIDHGKIVGAGTPAQLKESIGGDVVQLTVNGRAADLTPLLEVVPGVRGVKHESTTYRIKVERGDAVLPRLFEALNRSGVEVSTVQLSKPTLDQVYLEYTGRSLRDAEERPVDVGKLMLRRRRFQ
jgi:ABC-2 type transport system ATP-binding protein